MNRNNISTNITFNDKYKFYNYESECVEHIESQADRFQNLNELQKKPLPDTDIYTDRLSFPSNNKDINLNALNTAKSINEKTKQFKQIYYEDAIRLKNSNGKRPSIKDYMEVAKELKSKNIDVNDQMIEANSTDCSGFIKMIYAKNGKSLQPIMENEAIKITKEYKQTPERFKELNRGAELLRRASIPVDKNDVKLGDLIFFKDIKNANKNQITELTDYATHIGIVSGIEEGNNGKKVIKFIHKGTTGGVNEASLDSIARSNNKITFGDLNPTFGRIQE